MSLETLGLIVSAAVPIVGAIIGVGKLVQLVREHERRIARLEADDDAENFARLRRYPQDE